MQPPGRTVMLTVRLDTGVLILAAFQNLVLGAPRDPPLFDAQTPSDRYRT
jgi:hypothetical protein